MAKHNFICGCKTGEIQYEEDVKLMDSVVYDEEGFLTCRTHRQRRYGWRSVPYKGGFGSWSPFQYERFQLFGIAPVLSRLDFKSSMKDVRDNRDPQRVGLRHLEYKHGLDLED